MAAALGGLRVVELGCGLPASYATKLLGLLGADVVKVEPVSGDPERGRGPFAGDVVDRERGGGLFRYLNTDKRSVLLDPAVLDDVTTLRSLISGADLLVESLGPGGLEALGLAPASFGIANPHLAVARISPFGQHGPYTSYPATGLTVMAMGGWVSDHGVAGVAPVQVGGRLHEYAIGAFTASAALTAVRAGRVGDRPAIADVSAFEVMLAMLDKPTDVPIDAPAPGIVPCADGWVGINARTDRDFERVCAMVDADPYADRRHDVAQGGAVRTAFLADVWPWLASRTADEVVGLCQAFDIPAAPVADGERLARNPQLASRRFPSPEPDGDLVFPGAPWRLSATPAWARRGAPTLPHAAETPAAFPAPRVARPEVVGDGAAPFAGLNVVVLGDSPTGDVLASYLAAFGAETTTVARPDSDARASLEHLVARADVIVDAWSPDDADALGIGETALRATNARAVRVRIPVFGLEGPWRSYVGEPIGVEQAAAIANATGYPDVPMHPGGIMGPIASIHAAIALQAALDHRDRTGEGQTIEVSMLETACGLTADQAIDFATNARSASRTGNRDLRMAPQGVYRCRGGEWIAITVRNDGDWRALLDALERPLWATDEFLGVAGRLAHHDDVDDLLSEWFVQHDCEAVIERLRAHMVPVGLVRGAADAAEDPQLRARGHRVATDHDSGAGVLAGWPVEFSFVRDGRRPPRA